MNKNLSVANMILDQSNIKSRLLCCGRPTKQAINSNKQFHSWCNVCQTHTHGSIFKGADDYQMNCLIKAKEN